MDDAEALRNEAPSIAGVSPFHRMIAATVRYQDKQTDTPILFGVTPYYEFTHFKLCRPRPFHSDLDMDRRENVCVLGIDVVKALFQYEDPLDKEIKINGNPFQGRRRDGAAGQFLRPVARQLDLHSDHHVWKVLSRFDFPEVVSSIIVRPRFARLREDRRSMK